MKMNARDIDRDFQMFSEEGNQRVYNVLQTVLELPITASNELLYASLSCGMKSIAKDHSEVWDTEVRRTIIDYLEDKTHRELSIFF